MAVENLEKFQDSYIEGVSENDLRQTVLNTYSSKQDAMLNLGAAATLSAGIWIWNILDVKKVKSQNFSSDVRTQISINAKQQIVVRVFY